MEVDVSIIVLVKRPEQLVHKPLRILQRHHAAVQGHHLLPAHLAVGTLSLENAEMLMVESYFLGPLGPLAVEVP